MVSKRQRYRVTFMLQSVNHEILAPPNASLRDILDGFWVDEDFNVAPMYHERYYVMSHQIRCIEKFYEEVDNGIKRR